MSHDYCVHCAKCHESSESWNRANNKLKKAVEESFPLYLLSLTGWGDMLWDIKYDYIGQGLANFIVEHYQCRSFEIRGEYDSDPIVKVEPVVLYEGAFI